MGFDEFVSPIISNVKSLDDFLAKHYLEVISQDLAKSDKTILSGTTLKDTATLNHPERFMWLKEFDKPVLGICAGIQAIGLVFGCRLTRCLEVARVKVGNFGWSGITVF